MTSISQLARPLRRSQTTTTSSMVIQTASLHVSAFSASKNPGFKPSFANKPSSKSKDSRERISGFISKLGMGTDNGRGKISGFMAGFESKLGSRDRFEKPSGFQFKPAKSPMFEQSGRFRGADTKLPSSSVGQSGRFRDADTRSQGSSFGNSGKFKAADTFRTQGSPVKRTARLPQKGEFAGKLQMQEALQKQIEERVARTRKQTPTKSERAPRDEEITAPMIMLVSEEGVPQGVHPLKTVLRGLDREQYTLVMVDSTEEPPTCRIYLRKILYDREKNARKQNSDSKRKSKAQMLQIRSSISDHDIEVKCNKLISMLEKGRRVTVVVERAQNEQGKDRRNAVGETIMKKVANHATVSSSPTSDKTMWMVVLQGTGSD
ncbi:hypothetical protein EV176_001286 [Coemansia sp. RSA 451]|nr:hypothetical protein EV176_001286 [Coemansia sp. RSA 451]